MKKKQIEDNLDYDGYYDDVLPEDADFKEEKERNGATAINIALVGFIATLAVACIAVFTFAF